MSRRPAAITQADVARALKAAQQAGPDWALEIEGPVMRLTRTPRAVAADSTTVGGVPDSLAKLEEPETHWKL